MFPLKDLNPSRTIPVVNWIIIILNILMFLVEISMGSQEIQGFINSFGFIPAKFAEHWGESGQTITLFTSMFMHGGWLHLITNMWALAIFGDNVEDRLGHGRYLIFYLLCGVAAALAQVVFNPHQIEPTVGASGAIAGIFGAYMMLFPGGKVVTLIPIGFIPVFIDIPAYFYLGFWFVTQAFTGWMSLLTPAEIAGEVGRVAWFAHVGGFLAGFILVRAFKKKDYPQWYKDEHWPY